MNNYPRIIKSAIPPDKYYLWFDTISLKLKWYSPKGWDIVNDPDGSTLDITKNPSIKDLLDTKQDNLVSGRNIATINGLDILTSGNIDVVAKNLFVVVSELPEEGVEDKVYLLKTSDTKENLYTEYIWKNGDYELLGSYNASLDLKDYLTAAQIAEKYATIADMDKKVGYMAVGKSASANAIYYYDAYKADTSTMKLLGTANLPSVSESFAGIMTATLYKNLVAARSTTTIGGRTVTVINGNIVDLGTIDSNSVGEEWCALPEVAANFDIHIVLWRVDTGNYGTNSILFNVCGEVMTYQYLYQGSHAYIRGIADAASVPNVYEWSVLDPRVISYNSSSHSLSLQDYCNETTSSVTLPLATSTTAGLMSASDKAKLDAGSTSTGTLASVDLSVFLSEDSGSTYCTNICKAFNLDETTAVSSSSLTDAAVKEIISKIQTGAYSYIATSDINSIDTAMGVHSIIPLYYDSTLKADSVPIATFLDTCYVIDGTIATLSLQLQCICLYRDKNTLVETTVAMQNANIDTATNK